MKTSQLGWFQASLRARPGNGSEACSSLPTTLCVAEPCHSPDKWCIRFFSSWIQSLWLLCNFCISISNAKFMSRVGHRRQCVILELRLCCWNHSCRRILRTGDCRSVKKHKPHERPGDHVTWGSFRYLALSTRYLN